MPRSNSVELAVGDRVGIRTVIAGPELRAGPQGGTRRTMVLMECQCGDRSWTVLRRAAAMDSCGCLHRQQRVRHGLQTGWRTNGQHPLYATWAAMKQRCRNPNHPEFNRYGDRGIGYCPEWEDATTFIAWALDNGWRKGLQLNRVDNDGDYAPNNCNFVTAQENSRNTRRNHAITAWGETRLLIEWAEDERCAVSYGTLRQRISHGWDPERAISQVSERIPTGGT